MESTGNEGGRLEPRVDVCFWCGGETGNVLWTRDKLEHEERFSSYDPCKECYSNWGEGIVAIEAATEQVFPGQPVIAESEDDEEMYPTGRWMVFHEENFDVIIPDDKTRTEAEEDQKIFLSEEVFQLIMEKAKDG
jgi:hypothetical protein|tara:strand:- start:994 stop:1398 length:405 start_codon:yes stop_codon:yes gene_type:complete